MSVQCVVFSTLASCSLLSMAGATAGGATVVVGAHTQPADRSPVESIDHAGWGRLLAKYVDAQGMVDYRAWKRSAADVQRLDAYLRTLSSASLRSDAPKPAVLAFWINAYNAVTVRGILREYPTSSIRNHTAKLWGYNIWHDLKLPVDGREYSLDEIEHKVLRKMQEPRIHFAIVCASIGCPPLRNEAYTPERVDEQLTDNARRFFADADKFRADPQTRTLYVSPILKWFAEDFGRDSAAQMRAIAPYLPNEAARGLAQSGRATVRYLDYDWGLNSQHPVR